jgi:uncharacterized protein (TIGR03083 family)
MTPGRFVTKFAAARLKFHTMNDNGVRTEMRSTPAETLAAFRAVVSDSTAPPGPGETPLGEVLVHAEDIRRPLGLHHAYPVAAVEQVARFYAGSNAIIGGKRRVAGLRLRPTDAGWFIGDGPVVEGPAMSLVLAITGRRAALADLNGPGLEILAERP